MADYVCLPARSAEWSAAWDAFGKALSAAGLGTEDERTQANPNTGSVWQYMGSDVCAYQYRHNFRHREHPLTGRRVELVAFTNRPTPADPAVDERAMEAIADFLLMVRGIHATPEETAQALVKRLRHQGFAVQPIAEILGGAAA